MKGNNSHGIRVTTLARRLGRDAKTERQIGHGVDDHALVLVRVVRDASQARLEHIVTVEELLLGARLEPYFVLGVGREVVESGDVEAKLFRLGETAETRAEADELFARKVSCFFHDLFFAVVDAVSMQTETIETVRAFEKQANILADIFCELLKEYSRFLFG